MPKKTLTRLDTVVVGGGIAGVMCAYMLAQGGRQVTLIEANKVLQGVTAHTTAKINALQAKYADIPTRKKRRLYFESQVRAVDGIEKLIKNHKIDCDFSRVASIVFGKGKEELKNLRKEYKAVRRLTECAVYVPNTKLPISTCDIIRLPNQAMFNATKFCEGLLNALKPKTPAAGAAPPLQKGDLMIYENTRIKKVSLLRKTLKIEKQKFKYRRVIFATGFPIVNIRGIYSFKMYKSFSYAAWAPSDVKLGGIYGSIAGDGLNYRNYEGGVVVSGLDHRTGRPKCDKYYDMLKDAASKLTTPSRPAGVPPLHTGGEPGRVRIWCANDCMTFDGVPYAGHMFRFFHRKSAFVITGFGKWGMTNAYVAAQVVTDIINKNKNPYKRLFKPTRVLNIMVWHKFLWNFLQDGMGLIAGLFSSGKRKCPHMGCRLKFNPNTRTWDCPCHGSRFTEKGDIIVSPAVDANEKLLK